MANVTQGGSKEMLDLGGKPVIQWVVEEAQRSHCHRIVVVSHPSKSDLNRYLQSLNGWVEIAFQEKFRGLGDAVTLVPGKEAALVLLADTVLVPAVRHHSMSGGGSWVLIESVPAESTSKFGMVQGDDRAPNRILKIVEKPAPGAAPSSFAVAARYFFSSGMRSALQAEAKKRHGELLDQSQEIGLTEMLNVAIATGEKLWSRVLGDPVQRFDCGSASGYADALAWVSHREELH